MAKVKDVEHDSRGRISRIVEHDEADVARAAAAFVLDVLEHLADPKIRSRPALEATITTPKDEGVGPAVSQLLEKTFRSSHLGALILANAHWKKTELHIIGGLPNGGLPAADAVSKQPGGSPVTTPTPANGLR